MLKYLIPRIALTNLPPMFGVALLGALIAGVYGILHDHVTYSIGSEYFTANYSAWSGFVWRHSIDDVYSFVRVAYIHNSSYLGGLFGFVLAMIVIRPCVGNGLGER